MGVTKSMKWLSFENFWNNLLKIVVSAALLFLAAVILIGFLNMYNSLMKQNQVADILSLFAWPAILGGLTLIDYKKTGRWFLLATILLYAGFLSEYASNLALFKLIGLIGVVLGMAAFSIALTFFVLALFNLDKYNVIKNHKKRK